MTSNLEAIKYAREYLWETWLKTDDAKMRSGAAKPDDVELNGSLQYLLCQFVDNIVAKFNEVTRKEIALFIEHWVAAQGTGNPRENRYPYTEKQKWPY